MLTIDLITDIKVFDVIDCPVCDGTEFETGGYGSPVNCKRCGCEFRVRHTGGDAGCVVDGHIDRLTNWYKGANWQRAANAMGLLMRKSTGYGFEGRLRFCRILKEPDGQGGCTDDRGWSVCAEDMTLQMVRHYDVPEDRPDYGIPYKREPAPAYGKLVMRPFITEAQALANQETR